MDWKDTFEMNRTQRNGTIVLIIILILVAIVPPIISRYDVHPPESDKIYRAEADAFFANLKKEEDSNKGNYTHAYSKNSKQPVADLFLFNPNTISEADWRRLGLSEKQTRTIMNYRGKGGHFRIKSDLKKMYSIHEDQYATLQPYIDLPDIFEDKRAQFVESAASGNKPVYTAKALHEIDINQADTSVYASMPGIGAVLSSRIVKYREKLGGFVKKEQLSEVFGLKTEVYEQMEAYLKCRSTSVKKLSLNFSTMSELAKHPYIGYQKAKSIVEYRSKNGAYSSLEQLLKSSLLSSDELAKVVPYLVLNR